MPSPLANQTIARIQQARRTREAVSLPEVIKLIEELSSRAFSISVQELADLISHDTMVTAKVIQSANTFGYNPFGQQVTTVSQAIHVVGFNKIRNLALSMLLLENAAQGSHPEAQRESAALSLCSGLFAQTLAARHSGQDAEQAFVFACLRHYGRLLLTTFLTEDFVLVQQRPANESEADACRRIFGLTPLELTGALFEQSRLPRPILRCLQDLPPAQLAAAPASAEEELAAITQLSASMGELVISPRVGANTFADEAERLRVSFGVKLGLPENVMADIVGTVGQSLRSFARSYGSRSVSSGILQRVAERAAQAEPQPVLPEGIIIGSSPPVPVAPPAVEATPNAEGFTAAETATGPAPANPLPVSINPLPPVPLPYSPAPVTAVDSVVPPATAEPVSATPPSVPSQSALPTPHAAPPPPPAAPDGPTILTECLLQLTELMTAPSLDLRAMELRALTAIREALRLRDCLLFQREGTSHVFAAQTGLGELAGLVRGRPLVDADRRDVFGIALARREDVLIRDTTDPKLRPFLPDWLSGAGPVFSFILLPLHNETGSFAMIVGTRAAAPAVQPLARELQLLKAIRQHLTSARRLAGVRG